MGRVTTAIHMYGVRFQGSPDGLRWVCALPFARFNYRGRDVDMTGREKDVETALRYQIDERGHVPSVKLNHSPSAESEGTVEAWRILTAAEAKAKGIHPRHEEPCLYLGVRFADAATDAAYQSGRLRWFSPGFYEESGHAGNDIGNQFQFWLPEISMVGEPFLSRQTPANELVGVQFAAQKGGVRMDANAPAANAAPVNAAAPGAEAPPAWAAELIGLVKDMVGALKGAPPVEAAPAPPVGMSANEQALKVQLEATNRIAEQANASLIKMRAEQATDAALQGVAIDPKIRAMLVDMKAAGNESGFTDVLKLAMAANGPAGATNRTALNGAPVVTETPNDRYAAARRVQAEAAKKGETITFSAALSRVPVAGA